MGLMLKDVFQGCRSTLNTSAVPFYATRGFVIKKKEKRVLYYGGGSCRVGRGLRTTCVGFQS